MVSSTISRYLRTTRHEPPVQVRRGEDRVVVQHLLEVRDEPALVDRVAVEAPADDVVEPSRGHPVERRRHHRESVVVSPAEEELERRSGRELRRAAEAAERGLERAGDAAGGFATGSTPSAARTKGAARSSGGASRRSGRPGARCRLAARSRPWRRPAGDRESSPSRAAARAGSRCRRRTACRPGS